MTRIRATLHEDALTCMIFRSILLRMRDFQTEVAEKIRTHMLCSIPISKNRAVYEIMWKNTVKQQATDDNIIKRMRIACWITKTTNTHLEYALLTALPLQQWLVEGASELR